MLGSCGVGPWGPGGRQATRNSWLREWAGGEELALAQVPLCTGRLRLTGGYMVSLSPTQIRITYPFLTDGNRGWLLP